MVLGVPAFEGYGLQPEGYGLQPVHQVLPFQQRALAPEGIESQFELSQSLSQQVPRLSRTGRSWGIQATSPHPTLASAMAFSLSASGALA